jgi:hypothetical protein
VATGNRERIALKSRSLTINFFASSRLLDAGGLEKSTKNAA